MDDRYQSHFNLNPSLTYNFLKYNRFNEYLNEFGYVEVGTSRDALYDEITIKYKRTLDDGTYHLDLIGRNCKVVDGALEDSLSRVFKYTNESFVPHLLCFGVSTFISEKSECKFDEVYPENGGGGQFHVTRNTVYPKEYRRQIDLWAHDMVQTSKLNFKTFIENFENTYSRLTDDIEREFPKTSFDYGNDIYPKSTYSYRSYR